jgi:hypothetical protein
VAITDALLTLGRVSFYRETFGNEVFLSEIMGILDGPLTPWRMAKALWTLGGRGTTNLQIPLEEDVTIGGTTFPKGSTLNTGLDVVPGSYLPLGLKVKVKGGRLVVGKMSILEARLEVTSCPQRRPIYRLSSCGRSPVGR